MQLHPRTRNALVAVALASTLGLAACGSSAGKASPNTTAAPAPTAAPTTAAPTTAAPTTAAPATAVSDLSKDNFGSGCAAVPATGMGSFSGMAQDPAATAASHNPVLTTLVSAVTAAKLADTLNGPGPFTIFAPANDAFGKIDKATIDTVMADPSGVLTKILTYHVVAGQKLDAEALVKAGTETTVNGGSVKITEVNGTMMVNDAKVICGNVKTANATVFIIDSVLMPSM
jgi:uncharacterized surface protein with fasciclin (FAS1) repeats